MPNMTASEVYGYGAVQPTGWDGPVTENVGNHNPTYQVSDNSPNGMAVAGIGVGHSAYGHRNPLFWLLILALVVTGYVGLGFDFSIRNVGSEKLRVGK